MTNPIRGTRHGSAPAPLSVLDSAMTGTGQTAAEAPAGSIELVRLAGRRGFTLMDSSGINVFILAHQSVSATGGWLRLAAAQKPVLHVLQPVGIDAFVTCHPTPEQTVEP
ncbi:STAS domain-containing protein [Streptomyces coriariae]|uniref:STAS domain-containing protein n=1 Tax=Streptomyces coriariae TaxID=2864460 RepID=UPI001E6458C3|nr:STAS domain-containing protein [Streptomyces coriariae]